MVHYGSSSFRPTETLCVKDNYNTPIVLTAGSKQARGPWVSPFIIQFMKSSFALPSPFLHVLLSLSTGRETAMTQPESFPFQCRTKVLLFLPLCGCSASPAVSHLQQVSTPSLA